MADFVIKPSSGDLVLKDDQNAARLTVAGTTGATTLTNQVFPAGHVLQVFNVISTAQTSITSTNAVILTKTFNRKKGNSHFIANTLVSMGPVPDNASMDTCDPALRFFVNGSFVLTNDNLIEDGFYRSDVPNWRNDVTNNGRYDVYQQGITVDFTHISSGSDNDSVTIAVDLKGGSGGVYINKAQQSTIDGGTSSLTIWEIAS